MPSSAQPDAPAASISIHELHFAYADAPPALRGVSLDVRAGAKVALLGASGAGKSTLLLHVNGVHLPQQGTVRVGEDLVAKENLRRIRQRVGLVFQDPDDQLFHLTVAEDVAFGPRNFGLPPETVAERVREALAAMHLEGFEDRVNQHLSFGERRRASLATVLAMRPSVLALDEPFANLDPRMVRSLMSLLDTFAGTVLLASQDILPALGCCHEAAVLQDGVIIAHAPVRDIAQDRDLLRRCGIDFWYLAEILDGLR
ncbi:MAG: ABC transporter ATP-binding protein [Bryobacterales bacterium]|nr:ABC transporter ATP-binding protein [Bryobacterales bacterium]